MERFHAGEIEVQERVGVRPLAERVGRSIHSTIPFAAHEFLLEQPFVVLGAQGEDELVWASLLWGEPGFASVENERTVKLEAALPEDDPLYQSLNEKTAVGMIALEPATRSRMRLNGIAREQNRSIVIEAREVYFNCPKYIQKRTWRREIGNDEAPDNGRSGVRLDAEQVAFVSGADTFFIASQAEGGADASHRGGTPGFVRVVEPNILQFPDYSGNAMFNTLGNLQLDARAGLLFWDWKRGTTLQLAGRAHVLWDVDTRLWPGVERAVEFRIERVIERLMATSLRWDFLEASPFNPPL